MAADDSDRTTNADAAGAEEHPAPVVVGWFATTGEAEVAQAKLMSFGIESELSDQIEGGTVPVDGEPGVGLAVRAIDEVEARRVLARNV